MEKKRNVNVKLCLLFLVLYYVCKYITSTAIKKYKDLFS